MHEEGGGKRPSLPPFFRVSSRRLATAAALPAAAASPMSVTEPRSFAVRRSLVVVR